MHFAHRAEAGRLLAEKLAGYAHQPDAVVLALPRGGVPVGRAIADALHLPLELLMVRRLGLPENQALAMGAIAAGGVRVLNTHMLENWDITPEEVAEAEEEQRTELLRQERIFRHSRPRLELNHRTVIVVDDGIATGATMRAAVSVLREQHVSRIVIACPVTARTSYMELRALVSEFVTLAMPKTFGAVGEFYADFHPCSDAEVRRLLEPTGQLAPA